MKTQKKFAWFPQIVETWRPQGTKAIVWLQDYYIKGDEGLQSLNWDGRYGYKYILRLGFFSKEF